MALFFYCNEVDHLLPFKEGVRIAEEALKDLGVGKGVNAPQRRLYVHNRDQAEQPYDTICNVYAGGSAGYGTIGAQVSIRVQSLEKEIPYNPKHAAIFLIYDVYDGSLLGIMAHAPRYLRGRGGLRTTTTSLAGLEHFARRDAKRVGIYGSGRTAWSVFMGLTELRKIESAKVYSPTRSHREIFAEKMSELTGVPVKPVDAPREAARDVDIILCMTGSSVPVIDGSWLEEGQYIISVVGDNIESMKLANLTSPRREIDDGTLRRCNFIVSLFKEQAIEAKQGDLYWPVQSGVITWDKVVEIADVLAGKAKGRTDDKQIILYKNQGGQGIIDLALAKRCYELARETGKGYEMDIRPRPDHRVRVWSGGSSSNA